MKKLLKVLKVILKTIGGILGGVLAFLALCCVVTLIWGGVQVSRGSVTESLPTTPADFVPEVRAVIFTDVHEKFDNVAKAVDAAYELFDDDETYKGIDAIFGLGDFSGGGSPVHFEQYIQTLDEHVKKDTLCVNILGNHEWKRKDADKIFVEKFGYDPDGVYDVNGFTFIAFSGKRSLTEWTFTPASLKWASDQLKEAEAKAGDKPIFVLQHPHNFGTVYGSSVWSTPQTNVVWAGHNKVVNFSGHSHFPMNDPRSINQSTYTCVGVGAMARFETDKNHVVGHHPEGYDKANQFCVVEADSRGRVRILEYDVISGTFFNEYFIEDVNNPDTYAYTYKNMKAHDSAPVFAADTKISASLDENGKWAFSFDEATSNFIVHDYRIKISDDSGKTVLKKTVVDSYFIIDDSGIACFHFDGDTFESGKKYTAEITAVSAYGFKSEKFTGEFTAE